MLWTDPNTFPESSEEVGMCDGPNDITDFSGESFGVGSEKTFDGTGVDSVEVALAETVVAADAVAEVFCGGGTSGGGGSEGGGPGGGRVSPDRGAASVSEGRYGTLGGGGGAGRDGIGGGTRACGGSRTIRGALGCAGVAIAVVVAAVEVAVLAGLWVRLTPDLVTTFTIRGGFARAGAAGTCAAGAGAADDGAAKVVADVAEFDVLGDSEGSKGRAAFVVIVVGLF